MSLTKYPEGSLRELLKISLPLMLSSLSVMTMLYVDRVLLAHFSLQAMNSVANSATLAWAFILGWMSLTGISEVFVAQFNGAKTYERIGKPVWQMIYLSFVSILFFIPLAFFGGALFFGDSEIWKLEKEYFFWVMLFGPSFPFYNAIAGFFIGRGKLALMTCLAVVTNIVNALLDYLMIFGVEGYIPEMGVKGAAIATTASCVFQGLALFYYFMRKKNQERYHTHDRRIDLSLFYRCIQIGFPIAVFAFIELFGWAMFYRMMSMASPLHITVAAICQGIVMLLYFFADGIGKAAITLSGNFIGAGKKHLVSKMLLAGTRLHLVFFVIMSTILYFFSYPIMALFVPNGTPEEIALIYPLIKKCFMFLSFYLFLEGIRYLFSGILTSAGDTFFLMISGAISIWLFLVIPIYYFIVMLGASPVVAISIKVIYCMIVCTVEAWRFKEGTWKKLELTTESY